MQLQSYIRGGVLEYFASTVEALGVLGLQPGPPAADAKPGNDADDQSDVGSTF